VVTRTTLRILAACVVLSGGCAAPDADSTPPTNGGEEAVAGNFRGRIYERNFVFTTLAGDSAFLVPWMMTAQTRPGGVHRHARGFLARGSSWEPFYDEEWETPPTRTPWRILPHGSLRLLVGDGEAVEAVLYSAGQRQLELELSGVPLVEWTGMRGQIFRLIEGAAYLLDQRVPGTILDMSRVHGADEATQGDWAFLVSGDSLQMVVENSAATPPGTPGGYKAWSRLDFRDLHWPTITVDWAEVNAFQPARQDVPVSWTLTSSDPDTPFEGVLQVQSAHIEAGAGDGPLLPVDALFIVAGTVRIEGRTYPVRGVFRHTRP
jgi:hypothetical protein